MLGIGRFGQRKEDVPGFELMFGPRGLSGQVMIWNRTDMVPAERPRCSRRSLRHDKQ